MRREPQTGLPASDASRRARALRPIRGINPVTEQCHDSTAPIWARRDRCGRNAPLDIISAVSWRRARWSRRWLPDHLEARAIAAPWTWIRNHSVDRDETLWGLCKPGLWLLKISRRTDRGLWPDRKPYRWWHEWPGKQAGTLWLGCWPVMVDAEISRPGYSSVTGRAMRPTLRHGSVGGNAAGHGRTIITWRAVNGLNLAALWIAPDRQFGIYSRRLYATWTKYHIRNPNESPEFRDRTCVRHADIRSRWEIGSRWTFVSKSQARTFLAAAGGENIVMPTLINWGHLNKNKLDTLTHTLGRPQAGLG